MNSSLLDSKDADYQYAPITYHDSWLSVDPIIGCRLNCQYCFMQSTGWTAVKPERLYTVAQIVDMLLAHRYFIPHETILVFGNQTDSFLPENVDYTLEFFKALEAKRLNNAVAVVTKKEIPDHFLDAAAAFASIRPIFCLSYSGLPASVEKGVNAQENRRNFERLSQRGLRVLHFWRPLTAENGRIEVLEQVLDLVSQHALASVYIGLKLNPSLQQAYDRSPLLYVPPELRDRRGDYIPDGVEARLRELAAAKYPAYPLYKHTSCAVSYALGIPDYNATIYRDPICKGSNCPAGKRLICESARAVPNVEQVHLLLSRIGRTNEFTLTAEAVEIAGTLTQEDYAFLLHRLNFPIKVEVARTRNLWGSIFRQGQSE
ncbi:MAG: radical SAM protein [Anaerolinea sp.]|nr:radical SAM protein [Anaerolinea sp.]